jgi:hypothetical protein
VNFFFFNPEKWLYKGSILHFNINYLPFHSLELPSVFSNSVQVELVIPFWKKGTTVNQTLQLCQLKFQ